MTTENKDIKIKRGIIPEFISGSSTLAVPQETTQRQALKTLKPINNEPPYKDTTGRCPEVKAAFQGLTSFKISHTNVGQVLPDNKGCSPRPLRSLAHSATFSAPLAGEVRRSRVGGVIKNISTAPEKVKALIRGHSLFNLINPSPALRASSPARGEEGHGFTLIELLVVILIIAILAAIALPQYQKAVQKAKLAKYKAIVYHLYQAEEDYYLVHGQYAQDLRKLDIQLPTPSGCIYELSSQPKKGFYTCSQGTNTQWRYGIFDDLTNVQAGDSSLRILRFLKDTNADYTANRGDFGCWANGSTTSRKLCESLGTWKKKYTNHSGWEYQYIFSSIK